METEKLLNIDIYADSTGQYSEEETYACNCVSVRIPEDIVRRWYEENIGQEEKLYFFGIEYENTFETWLKEVYTCDDTDGLYQYSVEHGYRPNCGRICDGLKWYEQEEREKLPIEDPVHVSKFDKEREHENIIRKPRRDHSDRGSSGKRR